MFMIDFYAMFMTNHSHVDTQHTVCVTQDEYSEIGKAFITKSASVCQGVIFL